MINIPGFVERTLDRIAYSGPTSPSLENLEALQHRFLQSIPFENLDIGLGVPISLEINEIFSKIVERHRGGFCFECNSLFYHLLSALGYKVSIGSARMYVGDEVKPEFGHMVLIVELDGATLVDVGNGQSCRDPVPLDDRQPRYAEGMEYRVTPAPYTYDGNGFALEMRRGREPFRPRYVFSTQPRNLSEFADMCEYHQTSTNSVFTQGRLVTIARASGRVTLAKNTLTHILNNQPSERKVAESEINDILGVEFGINLDG